MASVDVIKLLVLLLYAVSLLNTFTIIVLEDTLVKLTRWVEFDDNKRVDPNTVRFMWPLTGWPTGPGEYGADQPHIQTDPWSDV